jgi:ArsR family transcriptional regulator
MQHTTLLDKVALALSDPLRLRILDQLAAGRADPTWSPDIPELPTAMCAIDLQHRLGELSASKLSYHMKVLRESGLVREHRQGKWTYYLVNEDALAGFLGQVRRRYLVADARDGDGAV